MANLLMKFIGTLMILLAVGLISIPTAKANSPEPAASETGEDEYHAKLRPISVPGLINGKSANRGHRQITLHLFAITDDEDNLFEICEKALKYRDALLTEFHKTPVALNRRGKIADIDTTVDRITGLIQNSLGNQLVTSVRLASQNVQYHAEKTKTCSH